MDHLFRELAPVSDAGWSAVEAEVTTALHAYLAGRRLVDFSGPHGFDFAAIDRGGIEPIEDAARDVRSSLRQVQPLVELRVDFDVARVELDAIDRGSRSPDLDGAIDASRRLAEAEDRAVFHEYPAGGIAGATAASPHEPIPIPDDYEHYPDAVAQAVTTLRTLGVEGPYGIALGPRCYAGVMGSARGGYPLLEHLRLILDGPVVSAPAVDGAVVVSRRGGDFELTVGEDVSVGYAAHSSDGVTLFLQESFTFLAHGPEAAIALVHP